MVVLFTVIALLGLFSFLAATTDSPRADFYRGIDPIHRLWGRRAAKIFGLPIFIFGLAVPFPLTSFFIDVFVGAIAFVFILGWFRLTKDTGEKDDAVSEK